MFACGNIPPVTPGSQTLNSEHSNPHRLTNSDTHTALTHLAQGTQTHTHMSHTFTERSMPSWELFSTQTDVSQGLHFSGVCNPGCISGMTGVSSECESPQSVMRLCQTEGLGITATTVCASACVYVCAQHACVSLCVCPNEGHQSALKDTGLFSVV